MRISSRKYLVMVQCRPVNTQTQLSRLIWWKCNATCWVYFSSEADVCFVNCLPALNRLLICGSKELFPYCLSLFRRGSFKVSGAEKQSWMRILMGGFAILEIVGADWQTGPIQNLPNPFFLEKSNQPSSFHL